MDDDLDVYERGVYDYSPTFELMDHKAGKLVLFQCADCRTILADTTGGSEHIPDMNAVVVTAIPNNTLLKKQAQVQVPEGTYQALCCINCKAIVGRCYVRSSKPILEGQFMFELGRVLRYQLQIPQQPSSETEDPELLRRVEALERLTCFLYDKLKGK